MATETPLVPGVRADVRSRLASCLATLPRDASRSGCLAIVLENRIDSMIRVSDAVLELDGVRVIDARLVDPSGEQAVAPSHVELVAAGAHAVTAQVALRGNAYGIFSMSTYRYLVRASHAIDVAADRATELTAIVHLAGTVTTPLEERPRISFIARSADARTPTRGIGQPDQAQRREPEEVAR